MAEYLPSMHEEEKEMGGREIGRQEGQITVHICTGISSMDE